MTVVVVGGGQAGFQTVASLRDDGYDGAVTLVGDSSLPYQRPPLSKAYLDAPGTIAQLHYRPQDFYDRHRIDVAVGPVISIDRRARSVELADGARLGYDDLVLATGCRVRRIDVPGSHLRGVHYLRDHADAERLVEHLQRATHVVVVGAGFIGLEVAAGARKRSAQVTVVEYAARAMGRAVSTFTGDYFVDRHRDAGTRVLLNTGVVRLRDDGTGSVAGVITDDGAEITADLVVVGVGVAPNSELAQAAGLSVDDGIVVDEMLRCVDDPAVSAVGDCSRFLDAASGASLRLESVQNAVDQARFVARRITGRADGSAYRAVPWFWTDQLGLKLQIAGLTAGYDSYELAGDPGSRSFSVLCFAKGQLVGVESVNRPADHLAARKLLAGALSLSNLTPESVRRPGFTLRSHLAGGLPVAGVSALAET